MNGINKKRWIFLLTGLLILSSCEKDEFLDVIEPTPTPTNISLESHSNQRSGISFLWEGPVGATTTPTYITNMGNNLQGPLGFGQGHSYHDINNDGYQDIITSREWDDGNETPSIDWYINSGDNKTFNINTSYINQSTENLRAHKILKTDVNNDKLFDFIILGVDERIQGNYGGNFTVLIQDGSGNFNVNEVDNGLGLWYHNGSAGDINNEGYVDVITAQYIWYGDGSGNFINSNIDLEIYTKPILTYEILDINDDGYNDMVLGTTEGYNEPTTIVWGTQDGIGSNNNTTALPLTNTTSTFDIEFMDVDNDGDLDILEGKYIDDKSKIFTYINNNSSFSLNTSIFQNSLDGGGTNIPSNGGTDNYGWTTFKIDDIDNDGVDDIICENFHDGTYNGMKLIGGTWIQYTF